MIVHEDRLGPFTVIVPYDPLLESFPLIVHNDPGDPTQWTVSYFFKLRSSKDDSESVRIRIPDDPLEI